MQRFAFALTALLLVSLVSAAPSSSAKPTEVTASATTISDVTSTTADITSTTESPAEATTTITAETERNCTAAKACYENTDCEGGYCLGFFNGKCSCGGCFEFLSCEDDSDCGGLKGACNKDKKRCACYDAYEKHGFPTFFDALSGFCNVKKCTEETAEEACFGLTCNTGFCVC